jgi:hypothetical protein
MNITDLMKFCKEAKIIKDGKIDHKLQKESVVQLESHAVRESSVPLIVPKWAKRFWPAGVGGFRISIRFKGRMSSAITWPDIQGNLR